MLIEEKRNEELTSYFSYFSTSNHFYREFTCAEDVSFLVLVEEAHRSQNSDFIKLIYERFFKGDCYNYSFDPEKNYEVLKMVVTHLQQYGIALNKEFLEKYEEKIKTIENVGIGSVEMEF